MMKWLKQLVVFALVIGGMYGAWWGLQKAVEQRAAVGAAVRKPMGPVRVVAYTVEKQTFADVIEALGTVEAAESANLSAKVTETVEELRFEDGEMVEAGQLLVRLSAQEVVANLAAAKATLAEQERELARLKKLVEDGAAPMARLEERETLTELAKRRIQEGEARLADRSVLAPFAGRVGLRRISPGALVAPGTVLLTLDKLDTVKLDFQVPEVFLADLKPGMKIEAKSAAWEGRLFRGEVSQVDSRVDPVTRAVTVRAELENKDLALRTGMLMTMELSRKPRQANAVPERAVVAFGRRQFVYVVEGEEGKQVGRRVEIKVGSRLPGYVEVTSGLEVGALVVTDGFMGMRDGDALTVAARFERPAAAFNPRVEEKPRAAMPN
jgi:membrane fusion protein (multidrug efflux system)